MTQNSLEAAANKQENMMQNMFCKEQYVQRKQGSASTECS